MEIEHRAYDSADVTAFLANRVVLETLSGIAFRRAGKTWEDIPTTLLEGRIGERSGTGDQP